MELSATQKEILKWRDEYFWSIRKIANRRQTSVQAVYKIINKLKKKGVECRGFKKSEALTIKPSKKLTHYWRLHGEEFNIHLLWKSPKYKSNLRLTIDNNTVKTYEDSVEVYSGQHFEAESVNRACAMAEEYWTRFFGRLESILKIFFLKPRYETIHWVKAEYAEINNEMATQYRLEHNKLRIYAKEDGKLAFLIDFSRGADEFEAVHPKTGKPDAIYMEHFFNSLRQHKPPTNAELAVHIEQLTATQLESAKETNEYRKEIRVHRKSIKELAYWVKKLGEKIEKL